jgi:hypothetical protein
MKIRVIHSEEICKKARRLSSPRRGAHGWRFAGGMRKTCAVVSGTVAAVRDELSSIEKLPNATCEKSQ